MSLRITVEGFTGGRQWIEEGGELVTLVISSPPFKVCKVFNNPKRRVKEDCSGPSVQRLLFKQRLYFRIYFEDKKTDFHFVLQIESNLSQSSPISVKDL